MVREDNQSDEHAHMGCMLPVMLELPPQNSPNPTVEPVRETWSGAGVPG